MQKNIAIPDKSRTNLAELLRQQQAIGGQIDAIVLTLRDALGVPDDYTLRDINIGFEAPAKRPAPQPAPLIDAADLVPADAEAAEFVEAVQNTTPNGAGPQRSRAAKRRR